MSVIRVIGEGEFGRWPLGLIVPVQDPTPFSPFSPGEWSGSLVRVSQAGYPAVELAITDPGEVSSAGLEALLTRAGLRLVAITTGQAAWKEGLSLATQDDAVRRRAVERIQAHMRLAAPFQAVVIVGLLRGVDGDPGLLMESLRECARADRTVKLALEPLNRYESRLVNTVAEGLSVIERVGAENLGLLVDTFHANIEESNIGEGFRRADDRLFHVHLADSNRRPPGHGHLDFTPVWRALAEVGYREGLVLECLPKPDPEALLRAGEWIRRQWRSTG